MNPRLTELTLCLIAFEFLALTAFAAPPPNITPDPALSDWFKSLKQPGTGTPCCSIRDCRRTAYKIANGHFEITIDGWRYVVPDKNVLWHTPNPTGEAVVCYRYDTFNPPLAPGQVPTGPQDTIEILCFIPPRPSM
jgi:hypothetical protein